jgi:1-acyl-sn-glycerol-3-phosphate acyltransferase
MPQSFHFVAAEVLEHQGLNGLVLRRLGHQFVERHEREHGVANADRLATLVLGGRSLVIFPEGGLARAPGLRPFHTGAFVVAAQTGVPVVPVAIRGTRTILRPEHHFPRRGAIDITVGEPIWPSGTDWAAAIELQHATRNAVLRLSGEPDVEWTNDRRAGRCPTGQPFGHRPWIVEPLRLFAAYRLAGASHYAAEELDPPGD